MLTDQIQEKIDGKTKPLGSLGRLETLAWQICTVQQTLHPSLNKPHVVVFAGDHGITDAGVSAYPQEVTYQMVMNFLNGGAAINVFCRQNDLDIKIVDAGVKFDFEQHSALINAKIAKGTQSFLTGDAMSAEQLADCFDEGQTIVEQVHASGCNVIGFGEMGIGNTSAAAMIMSALCDMPLENCIGRGTGLSDEQLKSKIETLKKAQEFHGELIEPEEILKVYGGFEIAQMCSAMLTAAEKNMLILVDGFIASSAYLVASFIDPSIKLNSIFCHLSNEHGHKFLLDYLEAEPLLQLDMRLGEGTGCAVAYPIVKSAVAFMNEMADFDGAGISKNE